MLGIGLQPDAASWHSQVRGCTPVGGMEDSVISTAEAAMHAHKADFSHKPKFCAHWQHLIHPLKTHFLDSSTCTRPEAPECTQSAQG